MLVRLPGEEDAARLQVVHDAVVGVFHEDAHPRGDLGGETGFCVHGHDHRQVVGHSHDHVVGTEGGGDVDDSGTLIGRDVIGGDDTPGRFIRRDETVGRAVMATLQIRARERLLDGRVRTEYCGH